MGQRESLRDICPIVGVDSGTRTRLFCSETSAGTYLKCLIALVNAQEVLLVLFFIAHTDALR